MQRPPTVSAASTSAKRLPAAARRRAAAMPAAPAPTITTSTLPERPTSGTGAGVGDLRGAPKAGPAASMAEAAKNDRRLNLLMVCGYFAFCGGLAWKRGPRRKSFAADARALCGFRPGSRARSADIEPSGGHSGAPRGLRSLRKLAARGEPGSCSRRAGFAASARQCSGEIDAIRPRCALRLRPRRMKMLDAAIKALSQMFSPPFRTVLLKSVGLALALVVLLGIALHRLFVWLATARRRLGRGPARTGRADAARRPGLDLFDRGGARHRRRGDLPDACGDRAGRELVRRRHRARGGAPALSRRAGRHPGAACARALRGREDRAAGGLASICWRCRSCWWRASAS